MSFTNANSLHNPILSPLVSWLMCAHVQNDHLRAAIHSCLDQTCQNFELIIVLNGPIRDEIERSINFWFPSHEKIRLYKTEIHHLIFSLNLGLNFARGQYIARMDSDDISSLNRLAFQSNFLERNPNISVLGSAYNLIDEDGTYITTVQNPEDNTSIRLALLYTNPINHPSVMIRRDVLLNAGGYFGGLHAEDYDLWCRLALDENILFSNLKEPLLNYRQFGVGAARRSRFAYATQAATQLNTFLLTGSISWLISALISTFKGFFKSVRPKAVTWLRGGDE